MSSTKKRTKDDVPAETDPYLALALSTYKLTCHPDPVSLETAQHVVTAGLWPSFLLIHKTPFEMDRQSVVDAREAAGEGAGP